MEDKEIFYEIRNTYGRETDKPILEMYDNISDPNLIIDGRPLLNYVASYGDVEAVKLLISKGADVSLTSKSNEDGPLHDLAYEMSGRKYITNEMAKGVTKALLEAGLSPLRKNGDGRTCSFIAAEKGNNAIIEALVEAKKKVDLPKDDGNTPLHVACEYAINTASTYFDYEKPKYDKAVAEGKLSESGKEYYEMYKGNMDRYFLTVKSLLEGGSDPDRKNNYDKSPKEVAFDCKDVRISALLNGTYSEDAGSSDDGMQTKGMNLIQAAMRMDHVAMSAVLKSGEDPNQFADETDYFEGVKLQGKLPMSIACLNMDLDGLKILIENGADPKLKDGDEWTPLAYCFLSKKYPPTVTKILNDVFELMKGKGVNVNDIIDKEGNTLLNKACSSGGNDDSISGKFFQIALRAGADMEIPDKNGVTPLMHTCAGKQRGSENANVSLLENGADASKKDRNGRTALMYAASNDSFSAARLRAEMLFEFGNPQAAAVDNNGKSALDMAVEIKNEELVKYLLMKM